MACKVIGPGWFIPAISLGFGIVSICTAFVTNIHSASGVRFLLGIFEAGMARRLGPATRQPVILVRLAARSRRIGGQQVDQPRHVVMAPLAGAFGGLLASAILKLHHFGGLKTWRMSE